MWILVMATILQALLGRTRYWLCLGCQIKLRGYSLGEYPRPPISAYACSIFVTFCKPVLTRTFLGVCKDCVLQELRGLLQCEGKCPHCQSPTESLQKSPLASQDWMLCARPAET